MVIGKLNIFKRFLKIFSFVTSVTFFSIIEAFAEVMPSGEQVVSGNVSISGHSTNHMIIDQKSQKSVINWQSFSINKNGRVDFNMPSSKSMSLNRVTGSTHSSIAGQLNSNGQVYLINPNGVVVTPSGSIKANSFTASSLDINDQDFLNNNFIFKKKRENKGIINAGKINVELGGNASLIGGNVNNSGSVNARLGKINVGAGEKITLDIEGDGLMSVILPIKKLNNLRDIYGNGHQNNIIDKMQTRKRLYELVDYEKYNSLDEKIYNFSTKGHE